MSIIAEYKALEAQIAEQQKRLEALKGDEKLKREIEFETKLRALLADYNYSLRNVIALLDPNAAKTATAPVRGTRRERALKRYKNPNNGEVVETKGGNHKVLKAWKEQYGAETVESWLQ
ncbi:histone-like nucleoid-structuring protein, MvaT/MvaU family [Pseudomonas aeruginosa]|uniref:histone-like nucleoid-structuring protein, MvaT/MvaU family n=1 Tax=Pseudomonadaceae TaxID=135621 RepID=UPI00071C9260|nr:histone-like nucleoid-structuring protein, MvaT/MvaU family [Pseudomonas aeruginosa]AXA04358.1 putative transcriptional regulator MvaV [Pseudomonas aeruginosa]AYZ75733.1 transcriptional regulator [Pseudomonas aeruginosa]ELF1012787.1 DNA binding protein [Pseudomonas aeruginosa]EMB9907945.1 DNA binding protein [Pseudomonas aeruginosa]KSM12786.1 transcriptional regulator [Pseudomonas aeruginosa]